MGALIKRKDWGAKPPTDSYTSIKAPREGTVHYTSSQITFTGRKDVSRPEKPGPKWYKLWRNKATPVAQRRAISRMLTAYNVASRGLPAVNRVSPAVAALERGIMRSIQAFHQGPSRNWVDIAYHRVIFASGNVYEGRPRNVMGAHAVGANDTTGYCFVMDGNDKPTGYMIQAFLDQVKLDGITSYVGHRQRPGNSTSCPGDALTAALNL